MKLEEELTAVFRCWFESGGVDFWSEANAPEELAALAVKVITPKLRIAAEALSALEHVTQPRHAKLATAALDAIKEEE